MAYNPYTNPYYLPPMMDQLGQLRQQQYMSQAYQQPMQPVQPMQQQQPGPSIVWVQGEQEAMAYMVAPNSAVALWDSLAPVVYLKQADASGKPTIKIYDLVERSNRPVQPQQAQGAEYVTRQEFEALSARLDALAASKTATRKITAREDAPNE